MTKLLLKPMAGQTPQGGNPMQIVGRRLDGNVSHIEGEFRQAALNIRVVLVPADESLDGKSVPEIMHTGMAPRSLRTPAALKSRLIADRSPG